MSETIEMTVWAKPGPQQSRILFKIIKGLAEHATQDPFDAHITLWRAVMPLATDADVVIDGVAKAVRDWKKATKTNGQLECDMGGVGESNGSLVVMLRPDEAFEELHAAITKELSGIKGLEVHEYKPHIALLHETNIEDSKQHLAFMARCGWIDDAVSALLSPEMREIEVAKQLLVAQATPGNDARVYDVLRELDV